jgi:hypothetical protein
MMSPFRLAFKTWEFLLVVAVVVLLLWSFWVWAPLVQAVFYLLFGWIFFLVRVLPQIRVDWYGVLTAAVCLLGLFIGLHIFLGWLISSLPRASPEAPPRRWSQRSTAALLGLVVALFTAGIGAVGVTHQTSWFVNSPDPIFVRSSVLPRAAKNNLKMLPEVAP